MLPDFLVTWCLLIKCCDLSWRKVTFTSCESDFFLSIMKHILLQDADCYWYDFSDLNNTLQLDILCPLIRSDILAASWGRSSYGQKENMPSCLGSLHRAFTFDIYTFITVLVQTGLSNSNVPIQGPVVQSVISFTSSVVKMFTALVSTVSNSQIFLLKKCE